MLKNILKKKEKQPSTPGPAPKKRRLFTLSRKRKAARAEGAEAADGGTEVQAGNRLFLHIHCGGWRSLSVNGDGSAVGEPASWRASALETDGRERIEEIVREAVRANARAIGQADGIALLLGGIGAQYSDNKPKTLHIASGATARKYGGVLLNSTDVTFGLTPFPPFPGDSKPQKHAFYAFADADLIRSVLALFDQEGTRISEVVPQANLLAERGFLDREGAYGALHIGGLESAVVLINHELGSVLVRTLPVGVLTLARALAGTMQQPVARAAEELARRDLLAEVDPDAADGEDDLLMGMTAKALAPPLARLRRELRETLDHFAYQRISGLPEAMEISGDVEEVSGLFAWLQRWADIPLTRTETALIEQYAAMPRPVACNLLTGAEGSLLTVGRTQYQFSPQKGFVPARELAQNQPEAARPNEPAQSAGGSPRGAAARRPSRRPPQRERRPSGPSFLQGLFASFGKGKGGGQTAATPEMDEGRRQERNFFALLALMVLGMLYWGFDRYEFKAKRHRALAGAYLAERNTNDRLNRLERVRHSLLPVANADTVDKVLWTEKFLSLADQMSDHIWLTDAYLGREQREVSGAQVESKKLVVEGGVLPSTDGHIQKISEYLDRLLQDRDRFMSDFRTVTFAGAHLENFEDDAIVRFTLEAWYDQNKRIDGQGSGGSGAGGETGSQPGLADMQNNIKSREKNLHKLATGELP